MQGPFEKRAQKSNKVLNSRLKALSDTLAIPPSETTDTLPNDWYRTGGRVKI
jgi:hypothetical protein